MLRYNQKNFKFYQDEISQTKTSRISTSITTQTKTYWCYLAKQAGVSLEAFSEALTHSDKEITKTYVNIKDKVNQTVGDIAFRSLKN